MFLNFKITSFREAVLFLLMRFCRSSACAINHQGVHIIFPVIMGESSLLDMYV